MNVAECLKVLYCGVLRSEMKVQKQLEALGSAEERRRRLVRELAKRASLGQAELDAVREAESAVVQCEKQLHEENYLFARAEQALFQQAATELPDAWRRAACTAAADTALKEVQRRRCACQELSGRQPPRAPDGGNTGQAAPAPAVGSTRGDGSSDDPLSQARNTALRLDMVGLALSGGGIRSATFGLGVLQGLAQLAAPRHGGLPLDGLRRRLHS